MPREMYQVYSMQRPGRPRWALAASGLLLFLSLVVAWTLIQTKARGRYVPLEDRSRDLPKNGLRARLPAGWESLDPKKLARLPAVAAAVTPSPGSTEILFVFRGSHLWYGLPSGDAVDILREAFIPLPLDDDVRSEPAMVGPFFARTIRSAGSGGVRASSSSSFIARVAFAPGGQTFGILLLLPRAPSAQDDLLIEEMSQHLELLDVDLDESPTTLMADAGIRFEPPPKTRLVRSSPPPGPPLPRLRLMSDDKAACWHLHMWRTPLLGTRTCEQLVESFALTALQQGRMDDKPTKHTIAGREVVRADLSPHEDAEPGSGVQIWCTRIDDRNAIVLVGQHEADAADSLAGVCESILAAVTLTGTHHALDIPAALQTGREWLHEVAAEKLTSKWGDLTGHDQQFTLTGPSGPKRLRATSYEVTRRTEGFRRWRLVTTYSFPGIFASMAPTETDEWILRDDAAEHEGRVRRLTRAHDKSMVEYTESHPAGTNELACRLTIPKKDKQEWRITIDDNYACQPVIVEAAAKVARDPDRRIAAFSTSEEYNPHLSWFLAYPLGEVPLPGVEDGRTAAAVRLWSDYDAEPETYYFDDSDHVIAITIEGGLRLERESRSSGRDTSRSFFDRRREP